MRPWKVGDREYAAQRNPRIERWFYAHAPWWYAAGPFLRFVCPRNFETATTSALIERTGEGVVYLRLEKPVDMSAA